jgi:ABC-2 type transport system ATP-binding protein
MADRPERDGATLRLTSDDGSRLLIDVLRLLDDQGLAPTALAVRDPSMDDVFLALTGRRAEAETAANGTRHGRRGARAGGAA